MSNNQIKKKNLLIICRGAGDLATGMLLGIAPCIVWAAVALNDEAVETSFACVVKEVQAVIMV